MRGASKILCISERRQSCRTEPSGYEARGEGSDSAAVAGVRDIDGSNRVSVGTARGVNTAAIPAGDAGFQGDYSTRVLRGMTDMGF